MDPALATRFSPTLPMRISRVPIPDFHFRGLGSGKLRFGNFNGLGQLNVRLQTYLILICVLCSFESGANMSPMVPKVEPLSLKISDGSGENEPRFFWNPSLQPIRTTPEPIRANGCGSLKCAATYQLPSLPLGDFDWCLGG